MAEDAHLRIEVVYPEGKRLEPKANANKFVHQCGVIVRDNVPISVQEWQKPKVEGVSYVDNRLKGVLWNKLIARFTLPVLGSEQQTKAMTEKVKHFALKKMAEHFNNYKNRLYRAYVKNKKAPDFTGTLESQRAHWNSFLEYKDSELAKQRSKKNNDNAAKKKYHHKMGAGGYRSAEPKWDQTKSFMSVHHKCSRSVCHGAHQCAKDMGYFPSIDWMVIRCQGRSVLAQTLQVSYVSTQ